MSDGVILSELRSYVADQILEGHDMGLDAATPLLENGVLNSMEITRLVTFIETHFDVSVPTKMILGENFKSLQAITNMVAGLRNGREHHARSGSQ